MKAGRPSPRRTGAERIVSLLPSTTEIACALGFEGSLVGRSHECDFPASVKHLPALTEPKLDASAPSREIDERVRSLVSEGLSVYRVDAARLKELAPSVILTQDQCEVCAASPRDLEQALTSWIGAEPRIVSLRPEALGDVWGDIARVAEALGEPERGHDLLRVIAARFEAVRERAGRASPAPRVACIEWIDPLMAAGNWIPELVSSAGGECLFAQPGGPSPWLQWSELRSSDPDVIVVFPCGFDLARTRAEIGPLLSQPGWQELRAVRAERVFLTDGNQYFNRPGPRLADSLEILAEILHPSLFSPEHHGAGWQPL